MSHFGLVSDSPVGQEWIPERAYQVGKVVHHYERAGTSSWASRTGIASVKYGGYGMVERASGLTQGGLRNLLSSTVHVRRF